MAAADVGAGGALQPVQLPADCSQITLALVGQLQKALLAATWVSAQATAQALPAPTLSSLLTAATKLFAKEPTLLEISPGASQQAQQAHPEQQPPQAPPRVTVVGDTHGQFHDVCRLFDTFGAPSADRIYVFNGDYVDRGAWGVEVLALLLAFKLALPRNVFLTRGNHECAVITQLYGFHAELTAKYGAAAKGLFTHFRRLFAALPLAALVHSSTLILHGGLFRAPPAAAGKAKPGAKRRRSGGEAELAVGCLDDLRKASKGAQDPDPERSIKNLVASDCMWSDPVNAPGLHPNEARGVGTVFGPDVTEAFLSANKLKLVIRSHEGPDARDKRAEGEQMPSVDSGYAVDHATASGQLVTLFSSPDYPQFLPEGEARYHNKGAVLHLSAPDYATPDVESFEAALPRPEVQSYYVPPAWSEEDDEEDEGAEGAQDKAGEEGQQQQQPASAAAGDADSTAAAAGAAASGPARVAADATPPQQQEAQQQQQQQQPQLSGSNSPHDASAAASADGGGAASLADGGGDGAAAVAAPQEEEPPSKRPKHVQQDQQPHVAAAAPALAAADGGDTSVSGSCR